MFSCTRELAAFLREQAPTDMESMMNMAALFAVAHPTVVSREQPKEASMPRRGKVPSSPRPVPAGQSSGLRPIFKCFLCDKLGHMAAQCRVGRPNQSTWGISQNPVTGSVALTTGSRHAYSMAPSGGKLKSKRLVPIAGNLCVENCKNLPMFIGYIGEQPVDILRDSGCSAVVVRRSLIEPLQLSGKSRPLMMIDKSVIQVPIAVCELTSSLYSGAVEVICLEDIACDVILGNIEGDRPFEGYSTPMLCYRSVVQSLVEEVCTVSDEKYDVIVHGLNETVHLTGSVLVDPHEVVVVERPVLETTVLGCAVETRASSKKRVTHPLVVTEIATSESAISVCRRSTR